MLPIEEKLDPRKRRTRQMLHAALLELIAQKPPEDISVQDIAAKATINRATFYDHFTDKTALMEYSMREMFRAALLEKLPLTARFSASNMNCLIEFTCGFLEWFFGQCATKHDQFEPWLERQVKQPLQLVLLAWFKEASYTSQALVTPELNATMIGAALFAAAEEWVRGDRTLSVQDVCNQLMLAVRGLMRVPNH